MAIPAHLNQTPYPTYSEPLTQTFIDSGILAAWQSVEAQLHDTLRRTDWPDEDSWVPKAIPIYDAHNCAYKQWAKMLGYVDNSIGGTAGSVARECGKILHPPILRALSEKLDTLPDGKPAIEVPMQAPHIPADGLAEIERAGITRSASMDARLRSKLGIVGLELKNVQSAKFDARDTFEDMTRLSSLEEYLLTTAHQLRAYLRFHRLTLGIILVVCVNTGAVKAYIVKGWLSDVAYARLIDLWDDTQYAKTKRADGNALTVSDAPMPEPSRKACPWCGLNETMKSDTLPPAGSPIGCPASERQRGERRVQMREINAVQGELAEVQGELF